MKLWLGGGEKSATRSMLVSAGVQRFGLNLTHFSVPKRKELVLSDMFNGGSIVLFTSEGDEDVHRYDDFLRTYHEQIDIVIGRPDYNGDWLAAKYVPVWNDGEDLERLAFLCQRFGKAAIADKAITPKTIGRIRSLAQRWDAQLTGMTSKADHIEALPWENVVVSSWTSSLRYGETQVFDGHGLRRYPAQHKDSARKKHRADIVRLGIDIDEVMNDDANTLGLLAIKSWLAWADKNMAYDPNSSEDEHEHSSQSSNEIVDISQKPYEGVSADSTSTSVAINGVVKRQAEERMLLPIMGIETITSLGSKTQTDQGEEINISPESIPVVRFQSGGVRQCNSCYLSARCPAFKEHSDCAYQLPIEIRTKDQLQAALRAVLEMQMSRVMFAKFAEELEGQGIDSQLSVEMERMFKLVEKFKDISDTREMVRMEIETRSSSGVLSRLFGAKVGEVARELPDNQRMDMRALDSFAGDIIDAEEV